MAVWGDAFVEGRDSNSIGQEMSTQYFNFHTLYYGLMQNSINKIVTYK